MNFFTVSSNVVVLNGSIYSPFKTKDITVSHLLFANDIMIFFGASSVVAHDIVSLLKEFSDASGLTVNNCKSAIFFPSNYGREERQEIPDCLKFQNKSLLVCYLGFPLFSSH